MSWWWVSRHQSFQKNFEAGLLPKVYTARRGSKLVEIRFEDMDDRHLQNAWNWWFAHRYDNDPQSEYIYEALQREKERRRIEDALAAETIVEDRRYGVWWKRAFG